MIRIGVNLAAGLGTPGSGNLVDDLVQVARTVAAADVPVGWLPQGYGYDAVGVLTAVAREVPGIELGTSVVVVQPRHPRVLAAQALTAQAAAHGRFTLGLGVSHPGLLEIYGQPFHQPVAALRAHLDTLLPILDGRSVPGATGAGSDPADSAVPGAAARVPVLLGALGPTMLRLAGERTDGTITFLAGPRTIGDHVVPLIEAAARDAGRPAPRVVVGLPVAVTSTPDRIRAELSTEYAGYAQLPSYRAALDRDGLPEPGAIAVVGDEEAVLGQLSAYSALGATDALVSLAGTAEERARTLRLLGAGRLAL
ncbi:LLM class F420-dependent oxidoreductase [Parafrankia colletiae]|uniref:LLM class F420-dependent oxidoreductase n=1 Tax=Parafrankia colletiae TaxID=573497 RepID=A0A1S1QRW7_9ACTN|nr:TIGR03564 family F420-dependent LLM class oxidoreductase [Parafrankia colletiae]MCK9900977.1 TIGR03564 family F420-dependent LLM class oxidoreductase [Frankia sp. Cpl3]OHV36171.1 LLM class F420-dependent oxidoreductase [Parafrankia colletiae]